MDSNAFERQLARILQEAAGPSRSTDVLAVVQASTIPRRSLLAAVFGTGKLLVAGSVVALFGGILLVGLLGQSRARDDHHPGASPVTTPIPSWPSTLQTEPVAPGIVKVIGDGTGHRLVEPTSVVTAERGFDEVAVGPGGEIWLHAPDGTLFRLGQEGQLHTSSSWLLEFDVNGSLYTALGGDDAVVRVPSDAAPGTDPDLVEVKLNHPAVLGLHDSGSFYPSAGAMLAIPRAPELVASLQELLNTSDFFGRAGDVDALSLLDDPTAGEVCGLTVTTDGTLWASVCSGAYVGYDFGPGGLARWDGETWLPVEPIGAFDDDAWITDVTFLEADTEGGLWAFASSTSRTELAGLAHSGGINQVPVRDPSNLVLLRLQDGRWSAHPWDAVAWPRAALGNGWFHGQVDGPGRLWLGAGHTANTGGGNDVLISYDGDIAVRHDEVGTFRDQALHPDGSLWVVGPEGLFVIDPEIAHPAGAAPDVGTNQGG